MKMNLEAFLEERRTGIGGSDIHALFNLKPYGCARRLWYEKRNIPPDYPTHVTAAMKRGIRLETVAAEEYAKHTGRKLRRVRIKRNRVHPFLMVHLDRTILSTHQSDDGKPLPLKEAGNLEIKVPGREMFFRIRRDGIDDAHQLQIQHSFLVTGRNWGSFCAFWADGWQLLEFDVKPDREIMGTILTQALTFWGMVENGPAPDRLEPDDARCQRCPWRTSCQGPELVKLSKTETVKELPGLEPLVERYMNARDLAAEAAGLLDEEKDALKKALGKETEAQAGGYRFIYRAFPVTRVDSKRLKKEQPDIWKRYSKQGWQRPLKVYGV